MNLEELDLTKEEEKHKDDFFAQLKNEEFKK